MNKRMMAACLALALATAAAAEAEERWPRPHAPTPTEVFADVRIDRTGKALGDTICLIGPPEENPQVLGTFETPTGATSWNGWTHVDLTQKSQVNWHADTYFAVNGVYSAWCGGDFPSCRPGDPAGGYGDGWDEILEWRGAVTDNTLGCTVSVTATLRHDTEPGYDYCFLSFEKAGQGFIDAVAVDGAGDLAIDQTTLYAPGDYLGAGADEVVVLFRVTSDGGWSDQDCSYPTAGACQLDDVVIGLSNGTGYAHDFEDGTLGDFAVRFPQGVGDFAAIWSGLRDIDPCHENPSPQVAFIDDGNVVPGTGGSSCINWCYGPGGHIVNTTGGLAGPEAHLFNRIESPIVAWPNPAHSGCSFVFDVYRHEDLGPDAPGMFFSFGINSLDPVRGWTGFMKRDSFYYGGPDYIRGGDGNIGDLLAPGRTHVQVALQLWEFGWVWGWTGDDGYPAPYFDNVRVTSFPKIGPQWSWREIDVANDNFIEAPGYDPLDPGAAHVRFDIANNIAPSAELRNDPGDSTVFYCVPGRAGAELTGNPVMHYSLLRNPIFDPYRTSGLPDVGTVVSDSCRNAAGLWIYRKFFVDLPDTGFLFPGDRLRYYIEASDTDGVTVETSTLPADISGFDDWSGLLQYSNSFTVRALPTIHTLAGDQPDILFWNDFANRGGQQEWYSAFMNLGLVEGLPYGSSYDEYYTNGPSSGVGNGLGGRATVEDIAGYSDLLYTCGNLSISTISNGDYGFDASKDVGLLTAWFQLGGKDALFTGDDLASDLAGSGAATSTFLATYFDVAVVGDDVRPLIGSQTSPRVLPSAGNPVFSSVSSWLAYGGCFYWLNTFDAVTPTGAAQRIAEFADASGAPGGYIYSAATLNQVAAVNARVISVPYDFMFIYTDPDEEAASGTVAARARFLADVLSYFGVAGSEASPVPGTVALSTDHHPNPFNPAVTISYTLPGAAETKLKIYDVRGALVRTLVDDVLPAGPGAAVWRGEDDRGARVASGIYFYELRHGSDVRVGKMTLVK